MEIYQLSMTGHVDHVIHYFHMTVERLENLEKDAAVVKIVARVRKKVENIDLKSFDSQNFFLTYYG